MPDYQILLIEDNPLDANLLTQTLEREFPKYDVIHVARFKIPKSWSPNILNQTLRERIPAEAVYNCLQR